MARFSDYPPAAPRRTLAALAASAAVAIALGCFDGAVIAHDPRTTVTWNGDIGRLVQARCVRCHRPDGKGPMSLLTYDDARSWAKAIREEVMARRMPKWHAAKGYGQFANDPSLSPFEISLFTAWADGGAQRGAEPLKTETDRSPVIVPGPERLRDVRLPCGNRPLPAGSLIGLTPRLAEGGSAGLVVMMPQGRREILAWIRHFEAEFAETYWLRTPLTVPRGSRLLVEAAAACEVTLHFAR